MLWPDYFAIAQFSPSIEYMHYDFTSKIVFHYSLMQ